MKLNVNRNKNSRQFSGSGISMGLVVIVIMCMVTFAVLSYVTAAVGSNEANNADVFFRDYLEARNSIEVQISDSLADGMSGEQVITAEINEYTYLEATVEFDGDGGADVKSVIQKTYENVGEKEPAEKLLF
ncbi:MAG: hypothetical protein MJ119_01415 [Lachnospiraceae bacterium]|nr:hypothetical protein [Lachnospiraceae bacterium]